MKIVLLILFVVCAFVVTGCQTAVGYVGLAQDHVLPLLEPDKRASYRDGLEDAVTNFDDNYDRDGNEWGPDNPKPSIGPNPNPGPLPPLPEPEPEIEPEPTPDDGTPPDPE